MLDCLVYHFLVTVKREVVTLRRDVGLGHAEALCRARSFEFGAVALHPAREHVRQVVLWMLAFGKRGPRHGAELILGQERRALVVEAPAVGVDVVEPDEIGAAGVGLGEQQDRGGHAGVRLEHAAGQRDHRIKLLFLDKKLSQCLVCRGRTKQHAFRHNDSSASARLRRRSFCASIRRIN